MAELLDFITTTHVLVFLIIVLIIYLVWPNSTFKKLGIPGPQPLPLIGNSHELREGVNICEVKWIKKYGKIVGITDGTTPVLLIGDVDFIKEIGVKRFSHFTNRKSYAFISNMQPFNKSLSLIVDDHWKYVRSLITPTFSAGKIKKMLPLIVQTSENLLKNMKEYCDQDKPANLKELYGMFVVDTIGATAFGLDINSQKNKEEPFLFHCQNICSTFKSMRLGILPLFLFPKIFSPIYTALDKSIFPKKSVNFFRNIVDQAINYKENDNQKQIDFLQLMMNAHMVEDQEKSMTLVESEIDQALVDSEEYAKTLATKNTSGLKKGLDRDEIFGQSLLFFLAGYETTSTTLSFLSYNLATHPQVQEKLITEIDENMMSSNAPLVYETISKMPYLDMVVCETLRMYPPTVRSDRECKEDCTINGLFIPKGMMIHISIWAVHYDEAIWPEPEKFIPERFSKEERAQRSPYAWLPFGIGPRNCVGMRFALLEIKIALVKVLQNFTFEVCAETEIPPKLGRSAFLSPLNGITLKLHFRKC